MAQKRTRQFKEKFCSKCRRSDPLVLITGGDFCRDKKAKIRNSKCTGFGLSKARGKAK